MLETTFDPRRAWQVILLCFVAQNLAIGFAAGSFGPLLASTEQHFGISRTTAAFGMSVFTLAMGGLAPLLGALIEKSSPRTAMIGGAISSAIGYWGLALLSDFTLALPMYGLIGAGAALMGILGPLALVNRHFSSNRGKLLAVINLPLAYFVTPFVVAEMLPEVGRFGALAAIGSVFLAAIFLFLFFLRDYGGPSIPSGVSMAVPPKVASTQDEKRGAALRRPGFWILSMAVGLMAGSGIVFAVHIVPFASGRGMTLPAAASILSIYAAAGIAGNFLFGWLADRLGATMAFAFSAACQALAWWALPVAGEAELYILAAILGLCNLSLSTLHGAAVSELVDPVLISRAMGISYAVKLPFIFSFAPAAGYLFDWTQGYGTPFACVSVALMIATGLFVALTIWARPSVRRLQLS